MLGVDVTLAFTQSEMSETANHTGEESFDGRKHWYVCDFTVRSFPFGHLMGVRFKMIKQDPRLERSSVAGDGHERGTAQELGGHDFTYVGDMPGTPFSVFLWFRRFMSFFAGGRRPLDYMFLDPDRVRPLTYRVLSAQFKAALERVGYTGPPLGLHGIRVEGYNLSKAGNGESLTALHGLWMGPKENGHGRYFRGQMLDVANIPARMLGEEDVYAANPRPRRVSRNLQPAFAATDVDEQDNHGPAAAVEAAASPGPAADDDEGIVVATPVVTGQPVVQVISSSSGASSGSLTSGFPRWGPGDYEPPARRYAPHAVDGRGFAPWPPAPERNCCSCCWLR